MAWCYSGSHKVLLPQHELFLQAFLFSSSHSFVNLGVIAGYSGCDIQFVFSDQRYLITKQDASHPLGRVCRSFRLFFS